MSYLALNIQPQESVMVSEGTHRPLTSQDFQISVDADSCVSMKRHGVTNTRLSVILKGKAHMKSAGFGIVCHVVKHGCKPVSRLNPHNLEVESYEVLFNGLYVRSGVLTGSFDEADLDETLTAAIIGMFPIRETAYQYLSNLEKLKI